MGSGFPPTSGQIPPTSAPSEGPMRYHHMRYSPPKYSTGRLLGDDCKHYPMNPPLHHFPCYRIKQRRPQRKHPMRGADLGGGRSPFITPSTSGHLPPPASGDFPASFRELSTGRGQEGLPDQENKLLMRKDGDERRRVR